VDQDERPEDERRPDDLDASPSETAEGPSEDQGVLDDLLGPAPDEAEPEAEPSPPQGPPPGSDDGWEDGGEGRRSWVLRGLLVAVPILLLGLLLIGWNRVAASDAFCSTCHEMEQAASSATRSVHDEVPCLACHERPGLLGALMYVPTFARETVHKFTPLDVANGVLGARDCESCHQEIASTPELAAAHDSKETCDSCHGDVSHPPFRLAGFERPVEAVAGDDPHPDLYVQTHGDDVVAGAATCIECHTSEFCEACHFRSVYPHPKDWIVEHGPTQLEEGAQACTLCHPTTFCAGCHGTEIPHDARWLSEHWRDLQDAQVSPCLLCHPKTDCTACHSEHGVHREQGLYVGGST
jgi:cytochrome c nitrite reductase small subunit